MVFIRSRATASRSCLLYQYIKAAFAVLPLMAASALAQDAELLRVQANGGEIEYQLSGSGEPVVLIHGTGVAATFAPMHAEPALAGYRLIRMHRRGFAGSSRTPAGFSIADHAADVVALLATLGVERAHIVGHSFGGMVALQLALDAPELVSDLVVIEPPIFDTSSPPGVFAALTATYESGDKESAMNTFSTMSYGQDWRELAARVPGGPEQVIRDVDTVFQTETPAMLQWGFGEAQASGIDQPILYIAGGSGHGASLPQLQEWIPQLQSASLPELSHAMLMQDPPAVAAVIATFIGQHPY